MVDLSKNFNKRLSLREMIEITVREYKELDQIRLSNAFLDLLVERCEHFVESEVEIKVKEGTLLYGNKCENLKAIIEKVKETGVKRVEFHENETFREIEFNECCMH